MLGITQTVCRKTILIYAPLLIFFHITKVIAMVSLLGFYTRPDVNEKVVEFHVSYAINITLSVVILCIYKFFHMEETIDRLKEMYARPEYTSAMAMMPVNAYEMSMVRNTVKLKDSLAIQGIVYSIVMLLPPVLYVHAYELSQNIPFSIKIGYTVFSVIVEVLLILLMGKTAFFL